MSVEKIKVKKIRRKIGDIIKIDLGDGFHGYGHVTTDPCIIFYDGKLTDEKSAAEIVKLPILFTLFVSNFAIKDGIWPVVAHSKLSEEKLRTPYMYKKDIISGELFIHHEDFANTNYEKRATIAECKNLECAAVWDPEHVVDRLNDHYAGRPNKWVMEMALD